MLPPEAVREYNDICERVYGVRLNDAEAKQSAERWLRLFETLVHFVATVPPKNVKKHDFQPAHQ